WENKSAIETRMATLRSPSFIVIAFGSWRETSMCGVGTNSHAVERAIHESKRHQEEDCSENVRQCAALRGGQLHRQFDGEKAEERCEFDDRIQSNRRRVLKRIANRIAHHSGIVERRAFLLQLNFHDLLGVIPCTARVGHKNRLIQTKDRDGDQITDEKKRFKEREGKRREKYGNENIDHALLCVLGADLDHFFTVADRSLFNAFKFDVGFDKF